MKRLLGLAVFGLGLVPEASQAHFRLLAPASWIEENALGDPQKAAPCGGTNTDFGKPTYAVTPVVGGSLLHVTVQETVYHPGHYRIALAVNSPTGMARRLKKRRSHSGRPILSRRSKRRSAGRPRIWRGATKYPRRVECTVCAA